MILVTDIPGQAEAIIQWFEDYDETILIHTMDLNFFDCSRNQSIQSV